MQKKAIILLVTLSFLAISSLLILKSLTLSEKYVQKVNAEHHQTQVFLLIKNFQDELFKIFKQKNIYDEFLKNDTECFSMPLSFNYILSNLQVCKYQDKININKFFTNNDSAIKEFSPIFDEYNLNIYTFNNSVKQSKFKSISSSKELDSLFKMYTKKLSQNRENNNDLLQLQNRFSFFTTTAEDRYMRVFLTFQLDDKIYSSNFLLNTNYEKQEVIDFEFSYK